MFYSQSRVQINQIQRQRSCHQPENPFSTDPLAEVQSHAVLTELGRISVPGIHPFAGTIHAS